MAVLQVSWIRVWFWRVFFGLSVLASLLTV
jgi:hypothetical protein